MSEISPKIKILGMNSNKNNTYKKESTARNSYGG